MINKFASFSYSYTSSPASSKALGVAALILVLVVLVFVILLLVGMWKVFTKAGKPGWAAIIPIYNFWVLFEIVGMPSWLALIFLLSAIPYLYFIPGILAAVAYYKLSKAFGKSTFFAVMSILFSFICIPILGFGKATFNGKDSDSSTSIPPGNVVVSSADPVTPSVNPQPTPVPQPPVNTPQPPQVPQPPTVSPQPPTPPQSPMH